MRVVARLSVVTFLTASLAGVASAAHADSFYEVDGLGGEPCVAVLENYEQHGTTITFDRAVAVYSVDQCLNG